MRSYNGFSSNQRNRAGAWLRQQWSAGKLARPSVCCACGQNQGTIDAHAEDYSEPFAAGKTDQYHLCFSCHMQVHCRFNNPTAWRRYKAAIADGWRFPAVERRNFPLFQERFLADGGKAGPPLRLAEQHSPPARLVLEEIENSKVRAVV